MQSKHYPSPKKYVYEDEVIFAGVLRAHYGHFLIECLSRLWYARDKPEIPIVWVGNWHKNYTGIKAIRTKIFKLFGIKYKEFNRMPKWQEEVMKLLGINNKHIFLKEATCYKKMHIPQPGILLNYYFHQEQAKFLGACPQKDVIKGRYIYLSRGLAKANECVNEKLLVEILEKNGWEIVYPEKLSVKEQVENMQTAEVCCFIEGSAQHTLILAENTKTRFIQLPRFNSFFYDLIAYHKSNDYWLLDIDRKVLGKDVEGKIIKFSLDIDTLEEYLLKTNNFTTSLEEYPEIFKKMREVKENNLNLPQGYYDPID